MKISNSLYIRKTTDNKKNVAKNLPHQFDLVNFEGEKKKAKIKSEHFYHVLWRISEGKNDTEEVAKQRQLERLLSLDKEEEYKPEFKRIMEEDSDFPKRYTKEILSNLNNVNKEIASRIILDKNFPQNLIARTLIYTNKENKELADLLTSDKEFPKDSIPEILRFTDEGNIQVKLDIYNLIQEEREKINEDYHLVSSLLLKSSKSSVLQAKLDAYYLLREKKESIGENYQDVAIACLSKVNNENFDIFKFLLSEDDFPKEEIRSSLQYINGRNSVDAKKEMFELIKSHKEELKDDYTRLLVDYVSSVDDVNLDIAKSMFLNPDFPQDKAWVILELTFSNNIKMAEDMLYNPDFPNTLIARVLDNDDSEKTKKSVESIIKITKNKNDIKEFSLSEREELLQCFIQLNASLFVDEPNFNKRFPLIPKDKSEYCALLSKLSQTMKPDIKPLSQNEVSELNKNMFELGDIVKDFDFSPYAKFEGQKREKNITQDFSTSDFMNKVQDITKDLSENERMEVFNYYGFKLTNVINQRRETIKTIKGYVVNSCDSKRLSDIKNPDVRKKIEELEPIVTQYTINNRIRVEGNDKLENALNEIVQKIPELHTIIGREQHKSQNFTIDVHSLKVMQGIVNNPKFEELSQSDKKIMLFGALFHDISKTEQMVDKAHPQESAFDTLYILKRLGLSKTEENKLYDLIKNHSYLENINKSGEEKSKAIEKTAFDLRCDNIYELEEIFTEADLKAIREDGKFFEYYGEDIEKNSSLMKEKIKIIQKTQPLMPISKIPKASRIKDGDGVYRTKDGKTIIKLNEVSDFQKIGFRKGINAQNLKLLVHGLLDQNQLAMFESLSSVDSNALLSTSYITDYKNEYRVFRTMGLVLDCDTKDIVGGSAKKSGSGNRKTIDDFINNYLYCESEENWRSYFSNLVKKKLDLSDDEYIELVHKYQNKTFEEIEKEDVKFANKLRNVYENLETEANYFGRKYNEVLAINPNITGVFLYSDKEQEKINNPIDFLEQEKIKNESEFLCNYAKENDMPILIFGD